METASVEMYLPSVVVHHLEGASTLTVLVCAEAKRLLTAAEYALTERAVLPIPRAIASVNVMAMPLSTRVERVGFQLTLASKTARALASGISLLMLVAHASPQDQHCPWISVGCASETIQRALGAMVRRMAQNWTTVRCVVAMGAVASRF